jgi:hypothetical protein
MKKQKIDKKLKKTAKTKKRIRFIKHKKQTNNKASENKVNAEHLVYDSTVNYYLEYWRMYNENEYALARIKETVYEIDSMKCHLEKLQQ